MILESLMSLLLHAERSNRRGRVIGRALSIARWVGGHSRARTDFPGGAPRYIRRATGYKATIVNGKINVVLLNSKWVRKDGESVQIADCSLKGVRFEPARDGAPRCRDGSGSGVERNNCVTL